MNRCRRAGWAVLALVIAAAGTPAIEADAATSATAPTPAVHAVAVPRPDHVVIVILENKRYESVVGHHRTPWITKLASRSANMLNFFAETHPSQPNYLALFSGSTQGVTDNRCPHTFHNRPNLGRQLIDAGYSFAGYSEDLPRTGWRGCSYRNYVRRHNPWVNFDNVPASANRPFRAFPTDYRKLPTVSFVVPDLCNDMHDCPKAHGDAWLRRHMAPYLSWAKTHNSLLILTFDEDNRTGNNRIATIIAGDGVERGQYGAHRNHYDLLRTLQKMYRLPHIGAAARRPGLPDIWQRG
jgi:acid phosphatase